MPAANPGLRCPNQPGQKLRSWLLAAFARLLRSRFVVLFENLGISDRQHSSPNPDPKPRPAQLPSIGLETRKPTRRRFVCLEQLGPMSCFCKPFSRVLNHLLNDSIFKGILQSLSRSCQIKISSRAPEQLLRFSETASQPLGFDHAGANRVGDVSANRSNVRLPCCSLAQDPCQIVGCLARPDAPSRPGRRAIFLQRQERDLGLVEWLAEHPSTPDRVGQARNLLLPVWLRERDETLELGRLNLCGWNQFLPHPL